MHHAILPVLGALRVDAVTRADVARWFHAYGRDRPGGANRAHDRRREEWVALKWLEERQSDVRTSGRTAPTTASVFAPSNDFWVLRAAYRWTVDPGTAATVTDGAAGREQSAALVRSSTYCEQACLRGREGQSQPARQATSRSA